MLYKRIIEGGTINERRGKPTPQFALPSTVNWMRALSLLIADKGVNFTAAKSFYASQGKRSMDAWVENTILEQLFLGLHHLSALEKMKDAKTSADVARVGILAWYYGVANAASAMTAAQNGSFQEDHAGTANMWDREIAARGLAMEPFSWRVSSLVKTTFLPEVKAYRGGSAGTLLSSLTTASEALGAAAEYLSGSAAWYAWKTEEDVRKSPDFKNLGVNDFRTKAARVLRDERLSRRSTGFVHQASRYRGNTALARAVYDALGNFNGSISDASLCQRVAYAESAMQGLAVVETAPRSEAAREITTLAQFLTSQMTTKARAA
jgi:hypothetical protein